MRLKKEEVNLTAFQKPSPAAMNDHDHDPPQTVLELIDGAVATAKHAAHCCRNETAREHFEFALALLRESWIAESGQEARRAGQVVADVQSAMNLFATVFNRKKGN